MLIKITPTPQQTVILLVLMTLGIYVQSLQFDFLNYDDNLYVTLNAHVLQGLTWAGLKWAWTSFGDPYYMPLTWLSFMLDTQLYGINAGGFHFTNLLLHIVNSLLLLHILQAMTGRFWESAVVAALFAVHPQHVEAVAWIAERKEVLSALFGLLALACYTRYVRDRCNVLTQQQPTDYRHFLLAFFFFLMSLLVKPTWVTLPCLLLLLDWWPLIRFKQESLSRLIIEKLPFFVLSAVLSVLFLYSVANEHYAIVSSHALPFDQRLFNTLAIYTTYLGQSFWPLNLAGWYPYPMQPLPAWQIVGAGTILILISVVTLWQFRTRPYLFMGWAWFLGTLFPNAFVAVLGHGDIFNADRWTYLPHIGLFITVVWGLASAMSQLPRLRQYGIASVMITLLLLAVTSWNQVKHWRNSETHWLRILEITQGHHFSHYMLGVANYDAGYIEESIQHFQTAHRIQPTEHSYAMALGNAYIILDQPQKAWNFYHKMITTAPGPTSMLIQMSAIFIIRQDYDHAQQFLHKILQDQTPDTKYDASIIEAHLYLGHVLTITGQPDKALQHFEAYLQAIPEHRKIRCHYAFLLLLELAHLGLPPSELQQSLQLLNQLCDSFD